MVKVSVLCKFIFFNFELPVFTDAESERWECWYTHKELVFKECYCSVKKIMDQASENT